MAYQGLFTQGPSVDDLLEQRNKRATDLQRQLMTQAGNRARDPAKAQAISFLGSTLGRALGNASGGGDEQMEQREATIEAQKAMQQDFATSSQGTGEEQKALAERLFKANFYQEASLVAKNAKSTLAEEAAAIKLEQDELAKADKLKLQQKSNNRLADRVMKVMPKIAESVREGDPLAIEAAYEQLKLERNAKGSDPTAAEQNWTALSTLSKTITNRSQLDPSDPTYLSPAKAEEELRAAKVLFGAGEDSYQKQMGKEQAQTMGQLLTTAATKLEQSEPTKRLIQSSLQLIDSGDLYTGAGGQAYLGLQKVLMAIGAPADVYGAAAGESFRSNAMSFVLKYIAQTKGAISNAEMQKFEAAAMGLGNTELGNRLILDLASQAVEFEQGESLHMGKWFDAQDGYPTPQAYKAEQQVWRDANRFIPKTVEEIAAEAAGVAVVDASGQVTNGMPEGGNALQKLIDPRVRNL
jgi:hypothetical protein